MKINEIKKEDLELMSYNDITEIMLEENKEQYDLKVRIQNNYR